MDNLARQAAYIEHDSPRYAAALVVKLAMQRNPFVSFRIAAGSCPK